MGDLAGSAALSVELPATPDAPEVAEVPEPSTPALPATPEVATPEAPALPQSDERSADEPGQAPAPPEAPAVPQLPELTSPERPEPKGRGDKPALDKSSGDSATRADASLSVSGSVTAGSPPEATHDAGGQGSAEAAGQRITTP